MYKLTSYALLTFLITCWINEPVLSNHLDENDSEVLNILMITGGGPWHNYDVQKDQIYDGLMERLSNIDITIDYEGGDTNTMASTDFFFSRHLQEDWAADFDLVIYNHCNLQVKDEDYVKGIVEQHVKHQVPAMMLHCPMHLYQYAEGDAPNIWWDFTGAVSYYHEKENHPNTPPYTIETLAPYHPILKNYPRSWRTPKGELYLIVELNDNAKPLTHAFSVETHAYHETAWINEYEGVKVFSSTLGHHDVSMGADVNLNLIASGVLWATGKLQDDGTPVSEYEGERGLGWTTLWDDEGTLNGWVESGGVVDWTSSPWYSGQTGWPTLDSTSTGESFRLENGDLIIEGDARNLFYDGRLAGGYFKNFEFQVDVYTEPESSSGIYFHTRYKENGDPTYGFEAQINASGEEGSKTGSIVGVAELDNTLHMNNEWFNYYIKVNDNTVTVEVNGEVVNEFTEDSNDKDTARLEWGTIAFQSSGSDGRVHLRNPLIRILPD
ncbi:MAG: family 16 glycoside hydrolase [Balneolaceae bacterium]